MAGVERIDGGISISQFGDPNQSRAEALVYLQTVLYYCDFSLATGQPISGAVQGPDLSVSGSIALPCNYTVGQTVQAFATTLTYTVTGAR